jgi:hypothetical protein
MRLASGMVKVTLPFDDWKGRKAVPATGEIRADAETKKSTKP